MNIRFKIYSVDFPLKILCVFCGFILSSYCLGDEIKDSIEKDQTSSPIAIKQAQLQASLTANPKSASDAIALGHSYLKNAYSLETAICKKNNKSKQDTNVGSVPLKNVKCAEYYFSIANELSVNSNDDALYYEIASIVIQGHYEKAIQKIELRLQHPTLPSNKNDMMQLKGVALRQSKHYKEALKCFKSIEEKVSLKHHNIAITYLMMGDVSLAHKELAIGTTLYENNHTYQVLLEALQYELTQDYKSAREKYEQVVKSSKNSIGRYFISGVAKIRANLLDLHEKDNSLIKEAINSIENEEFLDQILVHALSISNINERHSALKRLTSSFPKYQKGLVELGKSYIKNQFKHMLEFTDIVILGYVPKHASINEHEEHLAAAASLAERATVLSGNNKDLALLLGAEAILYRARWGKAIVYIENILNTTPEFRQQESLQCTLGIAYRHAHEYQRSIEILININNDTQCKYQELTLSYLSSGYLKKASRELLKVQRENTHQFWKKLKGAIEDELNGDLPAAITVYEEIAVAGQFSSKFFFVSLVASERASLLRGRQ